MVFLDSVWVSKPYWRKATMSEVSREEMLKALDVIKTEFNEECWNRICDAICDLIEKVGEWQARIKEIKEVYYEGKDWDIPSSIIREIRDFGKERP